MCRQGVQEPRQEEECGGGLGRRPTRDPAPSRPGSDRMNQEEQIERCGDKNGEVLRIECGQLNERVPGPESAVRLSVHHDPEKKPQHQHGPQTEQPVHAEVHGEENRIRGDPHQRGRRPADRGSEPSTSDPPDHPDCSDVDQRAKETHRKHPGTEQLHETVKQQVIQRRMYVEFPCPLHHLARTVRFQPDEDQRIDPDVRGRLRHSGRQPHPQCETQQQEQHRQGAVRPRRAGEGRGGRTRDFRLRGIRREIHLTRQGRCCN